MRIAIIGSGNVGTAIAQSLRRAGHEIALGVRRPDPTRPDEMTIAKAAEGAVVVILAIPYDAVADTVRVATGFEGKILIDATNPLGMVEGGLGLTLGFETSGAEQIAALAPKAKVFKTFNQTGFENMADARVYSSRPVMFVAGDDTEGKATVLALVTDVGFEAVDVGGLRASRLLEPFGMLWIELVRKRRVGSFAFSIQRRT